ncbi:MAG: glycosyltransferase family 2 protein [Bacteriovoracaceae bacterium]
MRDSSSPLISVIIPTFNRAQVLSRAIESVLNQSYQNFELIVVDDGSTDETEKLISEILEAHLIKIENSGVSHARNVGVHKAKGEWLAFLDSDDEWLKNKLEKQVEFLTSNPHLKIVHTNEAWFRNDKFLNQHLKHKKSGGDFFERALDLCLISPSSVLIEKNLFQSLGGFKENFPVCEDYDLWLRVLSFHEVGFLEEVLIHKFGGHEDQLSAKYKAMDYWRVLSMYEIVQNEALSDRKKVMTLKKLLTKTKVLLKGCLKHNNLELYDSIFSIKLDVERRYFGENE